MEQTENETRADGWMDEWMDGWMDGYLLSTTPTCHFCFRFILKG
jgi:hypothetical protein